MSFTKSLTKAQFKIDHTSLQNRALILCALLVVIVVPWYFLIYSPQSDQAAEIQHQISDLQAKTDAIRAKYEGISNLTKIPNTATLIARYNNIKKEIKALNQEMTQYRHTYISDKELAQLLHSLLSDIRTVSIEKFLTIATPVAPVATTIEPAKKNTPAAKAKPTTPDASKLDATPKESLPEMTRYSLSLKGDYLSIMHFLKRVEMLKWQLFWESLNYQVQTYPEGIATIEFYTLKPPQTLPIPSQGGAK